jgi:hypothetical protein
LTAAGSSSSAIALLQAAMAPGKLSFAAEAGSPTIAAVE